MAQLIKLVIDAFSPNDESVLPMTVQDTMEAPLLSDVYNDEEELFYDDAYYDELEKEIAEKAYANALHNIRRPNGEVYRCDFYKGMSSRISVGEEDSDVKWRLDVDHPVAILLYELHQCPPVHVVKDLYGDQFIYDTDEIESAIDTIISLCGKHDYAITEELN